jgi:hypothetical protein
VTTTNDPFTWDLEAEWEINYGARAKILHIGDQLVLMKWVSSADGAGQEGGEYAIPHARFAREYTKVEPVWETGKAYRSNDSRKCQIRVTAVDPEGDALAVLLNGTGARKQLAAVHERRFWVEVPE